jgi:hypothetical protein
MTLEQGGAWQRKVTRNSLDGFMPLASPCAMNVYTVMPTADPGPLAFTVDGTVADDTFSVAFAMTSEETAALIAGTYSYRVTVGDALLEDTVVLLRGYLTVIGGVSG